MGAKKAAELERLQSVELVSSYSALKGLLNNELSEQLKVWKLVEKKSGFTVNGPRADLQFGAWSR